MRVIISAAMRSIHQARGHACELKLIGANRQRVGASFPVVNASSNSFRAGGLNAESSYSHHMYKEQETYLTQRYEGLAL